MTDHKQTLINNKNRECVCGVHANNDHYECNTYFLKDFMVFG
jgi:hypothetical protein